MKKQFIVTFVIIFVLVSAGLFLLQSLLPAYHFSVTEGCNVIMFGLAILSSLLVNRQLSGSSVAFITGVSAASFIKIMACMVIFLIYILINRATIHKPTIFVMMGIYAIYHTSETLMLTKLARTSK